MRVRVRMRVRVEGKGEGEGEGEGWPLPPNHEVIRWVRLPPAEKSVVWGAAWFGVAVGRRVGSPCAAGARAVKTRVRVKTRLRVTFRGWDQRVALGGAASSGARGEAWWLWRRGRYGRADGRRVDGGRGCLRHARLRCKRVWW